ncbi:hypothetical protein KO317_00290 [Candidatus Micrarchaeota archaeon]|nr:hypothetical protein [Candidatus Micrarchaeota archaeon]
MKMKTKVFIGLLAVSSIFGQNRINPFDNIKPSSDYLKIEEIGTDTKEKIKNTISSPKKKEGKSRRKGKENKEKRWEKTPPEKRDYFEIENWKSREGKFVYC